MNKTHSLQAFYLILGFALGLGAYPFTQLIGRALARWETRKWAKRKGLRFAEDFRRMKKKDQGDDK